MQGAPINPEHLGGGCDNPARVREGGFDRLALNVGELERTYGRRRWPLSGLVEWAQHRGLSKQLLHIDRFGHQRVRTLAHRRDGQWNVSKARQHHNHRIWAQLAVTPNRGQAIRAGHAVVYCDEVHDLVAEKVRSFVNARSRDGADAPSTQRSLEGTAERCVVVNKEGRRDLAKHLPPIDRPAPNVTR